MDHYFNQDKHFFFKTVTVFMRISASRSILMYIKLNYILNPVILYTCTLLIYTTQNLISINVLFSIQYSVTHPEFDSNLMTMSDENACRSDLLFFDNALKFVTTRNLKQQLSYCSPFSFLCFFLKILKLWHFSSLFKNDIVNVLKTLLILV